MCTCNERTYVHRRVFEEFLDRYVALVRQLKLGDPLAKTTDLRPKVTKEELEKVERMGATARTHDVVTGGRRAELRGFEGGFWYQPTVLSPRQPARADGRVHAPQHARRSRQRCQQ